MENANGNEGNGNGESEVTQNATMLNTSSSNMTGNGTVMAGNSTAAGNQTASSGTEVTIAQGPLLQLMPNSIRLNFNSTSTQ